MCAQIALDGPHSDLEVWLPLSCVSPRSPLPVAPHWLRSRLRVVVLVWFVGVVWGIVWAVVDDVDWSPGFLSKVIRCCGWSEWESPSPDGVRGRQT